MVVWYKEATIVDYKHDESEDMSELVRMSEIDKKFHQEINRDLVLQKTIAKQVLIEHKQLVIKDHSIDDTTMDKIRDALINKACFAMAQKERFKRHERDMAHLEKKRVALKVDKNLGWAVYYLKAFQGNCDVIRHYCKTTQESFDEDIIPREELMAMVNEARNKKDPCERQKKCVICWERKVEVIFVPCGHSCLCLFCSKQADLMAESYNDQCPICRSNFREKVRVIEVGYSDHEGMSV